MLFYITRAALLSARGLNLTSFDQWSSLVEKVSTTKHTIIDYMTSTLYLRTLMQSRSPPCPPLLWLSRRLIRLCGSSSLVARSLVCKRFSAWVGCASACRTFFRVSSFSSIVGAPPAETSLFPARWAQDKRPSLSGLAHAKGDVLSHNFSLATTHLIAQPSPLHHIWRLLLGL